MKEPKWLSWAKELQAIAQAGLTYSKDKYDIERFEMIQEMSLEILADYTEIDQTKIRDLFANESGYQTPKVDVRAVIFKDEKLLLVQEEKTEDWAIPGGWGDIGYSPGEVAVKEAQEEAGLIVKARELMGIMDKSKHEHPPSPYHSYKIFILCDIVDGELKPGLETKDAQFFQQDALPPLSVARNTQEQIVWAFNYAHSQEMPKAYFD